MSEQASQLDTPERLDAALNKAIDAATQEITEQFQRGNKCADLKPYSRTSTIDERGDYEDAMSSTIELLEEFRRDMTEPTARVRAIVSVRWPVEGGEADKYYMPTNFFGSFDALPAMYDGGKSVVRATQKAKAWADSTLSLIDAARYDHATAMGFDLEGE